MGYKEKSVMMDGGDTIFLQENTVELPEVVVESRQHKLLHILAYVREYSTLTTYTDTVFLFREKMADYMLQPDKGQRFNGWSSPRVLRSRSYYRFTNSKGLDSVSDRCSHHFSWADWVGIVPVAKIPSKLCNVENGSDTVRGKYSPTEVWIKSGDRMTVEVNVLADAKSRKWVPNFQSFFKEDLDFDQFRIRFNYGDVVYDSVSPVDLTGYSFNIESNGRGRGMFMFNRPIDPFFVSTYAEAYIVDKEYITLKEAKKWERLQARTDEIEIYEPSEAPELQPAIQLLVDRVNKVDHDRARLSLTPDKRLAGRSLVKLNMGQQVLKRLKGLLGIDKVNARRKWNKQWRDFRKKRLDRNSAGQL